MQPFNVLSVVVMANPPGTVVLPAALKVLLDSTLAAALVAGVVAIITLFWTVISFFLNRHQVSKLNGDNNATTREVAGREAWWQKFSWAITQTQDRDDQIAALGVRSLKILLESEYAGGDDIQIAEDALQLIGTD